MPGKHTATAAGSEVERRAVDKKSQSGHCSQGAHSLGCCYAWEYGSIAAAVRGSALLMVQALMHDTLEVFAQMKALLPLCKHVPVVVSLLCLDSMTFLHLHPTLEPHAHMHTSK